MRANRWGLILRVCLLFGMLGWAMNSNAQSRRILQSKSAQEALFQEGMRHYMKEDYAEAILVWESLLAVLPQEPSLAFYLAKSYML